VTFTALAILAIAAGLVPLILRDLRRAVARRHTVRVRITLYVGELVIAVREAQRSMENLRRTLAAAKKADR
jgi:hypothetical protein